MPLDVRNTDFVVQKQIYENDAKSVSVVLAKSVKSNVAVAIKSVRKGALQNLISAEIRALRLLRGCSFVIQLLEVFEDEDFVHLVLEWAPSDLMEELGMGQTNPLLRVLVFL
jgi:serine/threonine protein kinase